MKSVTRDIDRKHHKPVKLRFDGPVTGHISVGHRKQITFGYGILTFQTVPSALKMLRQLHRRASGSSRGVSLQSVRHLQPWEAAILHGQTTSCILGTLLVSSPLARTQLCSQIFNFARGTRSVVGLEPIMLSAIVSTRNTEPSLAEAGLETWLRLAPHARPEFTKLATPVMDAGTGQITFLTPGQLAASAGEEEAGQLIAKLPGYGEDANADPNAGCVSTVTGIGIGLGAAAGFVTGAVAGIAGGPVGIVFGAIGGLIIGALGGAQGGQSAGQSIFCTGGTPGVGGLDTGWVLPDDPSLKDNADYNKGFGDGWAAANNGSSLGAPPSSPSADYSQGFLNGFAAGTAATQVTTTTDPGTGAITSTLPDGTTVTTQTDGTTTTVDPNNGTTTVVDPNGNTTTTDANGTTTTTDPNGDTTVTDPHGNTTDFPNPDNGGPLTGTDPEGAPRGPIQAGVSFVPVGAGLSSLVNPLIVGNAQTSFITGLPQLAISGGLATAGILAGSNIAGNEIL